jgi:hypothetical protein
MKLCEKCGNELSKMGCCIHPITGKKYIICRTCFMKLDKLVKQWRSFVYTHPDIIDTLTLTEDRGG